MDGDLHGRLCGAVETLTTKPYSYHYDKSLVEEKFGKLCQIAKLHSPNFVLKM